MPATRAGPLGVMVKSLRRFSIILLVVFIQPGCTTCETTLIESLTQGDWSADLEFRVCGSASGYAVAVYKEEDGPLKAGEGELEPFLSIYKEHKHSPQSPVPVEIKWIDDKHLEIKHITRANLDDSTTDLMIRKAKPEFHSVKISYDPKPVIWEWHLTTAPS